MDKKTMILGVLVLASVIGFVLLHMGVQSNPFIVGLGFALSSVCILIASVVAMIDFK